MNLIGQDLRRWQINQQAWAAITVRDYTGAAYLIGYSEGMNEP